MFAHVPQVPGLVQDTVEAIDLKHHIERGGKWHPCGTVVKKGWWFDGRTFRPATDQDLAKKAV